MHLLLPILSLIAVALPAAEPAASLSLVAGGRTLASVALPAGWSAVAAAEGKQVVIPAQKRPHIQAWPLAVKSVAEAEAGIAKLIASEVRDFAPAQRSDLTVAGAPARQLVGPGVEADDGDPGNVEATLFSLAGQVFVLLSHGEGTGPAERHAELAAVLASLKAP